MWRGKLFHETIADNCFYKSSEKGDLVSNPFVKLFNYGKTGSKEVHWMYDHMV